MSILVDVHLLSGKRASVEVEADASLESLKQRAHRVLEVPRGRLLKSSGEVLEGPQTINDAKLMTGDTLTLHVNQVRLNANRRIDRLSAFAALLGDGSVVARGDDYNGGDTSAVQEQLRDVQQIQTSEKAFAAILGDGSDRHLGEGKLWWRQ